MTMDCSDNGAALAGYTEQYLASCAGFDLHISVRPDTDLDGRFRAFDHDAQEFIAVNGWLFSFEHIPN